MKAIILCAGEGTRLRPLTHTGAKHLIPVANKPVVHYVIEDLIRAGIRSIGVIVSPNVERAFQRDLEDGTRWGISIEYILQGEPKGLAHAVACAQEFVGDQPFVMTLGDNLLEHGMASYVEKFKKGDANAMVLLHEVDNPSRFGVAVLEGDRIVKLLEKPKVPPSKLAIVGVYLFDRHVFDAIAKIKPSWRGELEITDAMQQLIDDGHAVAPALVQGWWRDVGKPEDMLDANRLMLERVDTRLEGDIDDATVVRGRVRLSAGSVVRHSELRGPLIVGPGVRIEHAFIGPFTAIDQNCTVIHSEIEYSIVMEGSTIQGVSRVDHSLIGRNVTVGYKTSLPKVHRLILGDNSHIELV